MTLAESAEHPLWWQLGKRIFFENCGEKRGAARTISCRVTINALLLVGKSFFNPPFITSIVNYTHFICYQPPLVTGPTHAVIIEIRWMQPRDTKNVWITESRGSLYELNICYRHQIWFQTVSAGWGGNAWSASLTIDRWISNRPKKQSARWSVCPRISFPLCDPIPSRLLVVSTPFTSRHDRQCSLSVSLPYSPLLMTILPRYYITILPLLLLHLSTLARTPFNLNVVVINMCMHYMLFLSFMHYFLAVG